MALPSSGSISLGQVNVELGLPQTTQISMNATNVRTLFGVASGAIGLGNGFGKSNIATYNLTIAANTANYNLRNAAIAAGWNGTSPANINCTINSGVYVYSTSTGAYAFDTGTGYPASGVTLNLTNNGTILGMGGGGGGGTAYNAGASIPGAAAGPAFLAQRAINVTNNGVISGGGGGGGGGTWG